MKIKSVLLLLCIFPSLFAMDNAQEKYAAEKLQLAYEVRLASQVKKGEVRFAYPKKPYQERDYSGLGRAGSKLCSAQSVDEMGKGAKKVINKFVINFRKNYSQEKKEQKEYLTKLSIDELLKPGLVCNTDGNVHHISIEGCHARLIPAKWGFSSRFFPAEWPTNLKTCDCGEGCQNENHQDSVTYCNFQTNNEQTATTNRLIEEDINSNYFSEQKRKIKVICSTVLEHKGTKVVAGLTNTGHLLVLKNKHRFPRPIKIDYDYSKKEKKDKLITIALAAGCAVPLIFLVKSTLGIITKGAVLACLLVMAGQLLR